MCVIANEKTTIGKVSLLSSISGVLLPVISMNLTTMFRTKFHVDAICMNAAFVVLGLILELLAFDYGIAARRTATGIVGLSISVIALSIAVGFVVFFFVNPPRMCW